MSIKQGNNTIAGVSNPFSTKDIVDYPDKRFVTDSQQASITHINRATLDKVSETGGKPTYNNLPIYAGTPQYAQVSRVADQTLTSGSWLSIIQNTVTSNTANLWNASAPTKFTVSEAGYYVIAASVFIISVGSEGAMRLCKNGNTNLAQININIPGNYSGALMTVVFMDVNDYVEVQATQYSGTNKNCRCTNFSILKVKD